VSRSEEVVALGRPEAKLVYSSRGVFERIPQPTVHDKDRLLQSVYVSRIGHRNQGGFLQ
jgi:hypothetical protein